MREIFLVRHGQAESSSPTGDAGRRLTTLGRAQASGVAKGLSRVGVRVDTIWHSPFVRAVETAELVGETLGCSLMVEDTGITPGGDPDWIAERILEDRTPRLMLVSHLPFLPGLVGSLLRSPVRIDIGTADLVHLALLGDGPAFLRAHVPNDWWEQSA